MSYQVGNPGPAAASTTGGKSQDNSQIIFDKYLQHTARLVMFSTRHYWESLASVISLAEI